MSIKKIQCLFQFLQCTFFLTPTSPGPQGSDKSNIIKTTLTFNKWQLILWTISATGNISQAEAAPFGQASDGSADYKKISTRNIIVLL